MAEDKPDRITIVAGHPIRRTAASRLAFTRTRSRDRSVDRSDIESTYDEAFDTPRDVDMRHKQVHNIRLQVLDLNSNDNLDLQRMATSAVSHASRKFELQEANSFSLAYQSTGIIYGDIGTSPLYVYSSTFTKPPSYNDLLGSLSIIIWSLTIIVTIKYVVVVLNADNEGQGGTFAMYSLLTRYVRQPQIVEWWN
jgi:hypothetical protein